MELTKEQIQQINNFLEAIGMHFVDIRIEIIDHIASEIEHNVTNIDSFFENQRLHTPFLKYMLSKKTDFKHRYDIIVKKKFWSDTLVIGKDLIKQLAKARNSLIISITFLISFLLVRLQHNNVIYFPVLLLVTYFIYYWWTTRKFIKAYGNIKIVHTYSIIGGIIINIIFQIHNLFNLTKFNSGWNLSLYCSLIISFVIFFLVGESLISKIESIKNKYQQFI